MKRGTRRILTTHTGSLPRPPDLVQLLADRDAARQVDERVLAARVKEAVAEIVEKQVANGVDVVCDGEMSKLVYATYVKERLTGFEGEPRNFVAHSPEDVEFPEYTQRRHAAWPVFERPSCNGPIRPKDSSAVYADIANLSAVLQTLQVEEAFMTAASPGVVGLFLANDYYSSYEEYVHAIAMAMRDEYRAIVGAGFVLQLDSPDLALGRHIGYAIRTTEDFLRLAEQNVEALNAAIEGLPADRVRMHLCWGNDEGPHTSDIPLKDIIGIVFKARVQGIAFEACNPRHDHEWALFETVKLPPDVLLIPGVIDSTNNFVEHPEVVAQRITRLARLVGPENVMAGSDCGFGTFAGSNIVDARIVWAKMQAMAEGAAIASKRLYR